MPDTHHITTIIIIIFLKNTLFIQHFPKPSYTALWSQNETNKVRLLKQNENQANNRVQKTKIKINSNNQTNNNKKDILTMKKLLKGLFKRQVFKSDLKASLRSSGRDSMHLKSSNHHHALVFIPALIYETVLLVNTEA